MVEVLGYRQYGRVGLGVRLLEGRSEAQRAARCAFWLAFELMNAAEMAHAGGWLARAQRLLEGCALGDEDRAQMEFDAACWAFSGLGAAPDVAGWRW
jgi:hypothetical protein